MRSTTRYFLLGSFGLAAAGAVVYASVPHLASGTCGNEVIATHPSPDGRFNVLVFERDCGATTDFSTQVTLLHEGQNLRNESGNLFIVDTDHGRAAPGPRGGPWVDVRWVGHDSLLIQFDSAARIFHQTPVIDGINVTYGRIRRPGA